MKREFVLTLLLAACHRPDPVARARVVERDQLRREVAGFQSLKRFAPGKLMDREHEVIVSVSDTLLRSVLEASFPITIELPKKLTVTLTGASVAFRANVARVDFAGQVRRNAFPRVAASIFLRGALDSFVVFRKQVLRARISIDDVALEAVAGAPVALNSVVVSVLQQILEGSLTELTEGLPAVALPVRIDQAMALPGFGPEGALSIAPSAAPMSVSVSRVIAFQNRLWIMLRVELGAFVTAVRDTAVRDTAAPDTAAGKP